MAIQNDLGDIPAVPVIVAQVKQGRLSEWTIQVLLRVVFYSSNRDFIPLLQPLLAHVYGRIVAKTLRSLATLAVSQDGEIANMAATQCHHGDPTVRLEVFKILGKTCCSHLIDTVAAGLGDGDYQVRQQAAKSLANYGAKGLELAQAQLQLPDPECVKSAIATIGQFRTQQASDILFDYLAADRRLLARTRKWQQQIPANDSRWLPMTIAIADYHKRVIQRVLYILSSLGYCILLKLEKSRFISLGTQRPHLILEVCRFPSQRLREIDEYRMGHDEPLWPAGGDGEAVVNGGQGDGSNDPDSPTNGEEAKGEVVVTSGVTVLEQP